MGYRSFWSTDSPDTIIIEATPPKDWKSFHAACDEAHRMAHSVERPVAVIFDLTQAPDPAGRNALSNMRAQAAKIPPNVAAVIVVGYSPLGQTFIQILSTVFGKRYNATTTLEEAYELVEWMLEEASGQQGVA